MDATYLMGSQHCIAFVLTLGHSLWQGSPHGAVAVLPVLLLFAGWGWACRLAGTPGGGPGPGEPPRPATGIGRLLGRSRRQRVRRALAAALAIALIAAAIGGLWRMFREPAPDPSVWVGQHLRLLGVRPDGGDELLDPAGKPIGQLRDYSARHVTWGNDEMPRDFVLELPPGDEPVVFLPGKLGPAGGHWSASPHSATVFRHADGRRLAVFAVRMNRTHRVGRYWSRRRDTTHVDMVVRYFLGPRGPADARFTGPFKVGATVQDDAGKGYQLANKAPRRGDERTIEFDVGINAELRFGMPLILYDSDGGWHLAQHRGGSLGGRKSTLGFSVHGLALDKVKSITFNEKPHEEHFRNILVRYADRPQRRYAAWLDEMADRLGMVDIDPNTVARYEFQSPEEAIRCIDLVRGQSVYGAWRAIRFGKRKLKPEDLDAEQANRLRAAAKTWLDADEPGTRRYGIQLGLWGGWGEFVAPALEMVCGDSGYRNDAARALQEYGERLTAQQIDRIKQILLARDDPMIHWPLLNCLRHNTRSPAATRALWGLAESEKVWLWWPALQYLRNRKAIKPTDPLSDRTKRRLVAMGMTDLVGGAEQIAPEARGLLLRELTPKLVAVSLSTFSEVLRAAVKEADHKAASAELVRFLKQLLAEWDDHKVEGRSVSNWWAVDRAVKHLNGWHGVNIGGLGSDVSRESGQHAFDWKAIAAQAVWWWQTGIDPGKLPPGFRPGDGDLRVVWLNKVDPELSVVSLWVRPTETGPGPAVQVMELERDFLGCQIAPATVDGEGGYHVKLKLGVLQSHSKELERRITRAELPVELGIPKYDQGHMRGDVTGRQWKVTHWQGKWELWLEPAGDSGGALDNTSLFGDWKKQYLSGPLAGPQPRVFFRHPRPAVRQYVLDRRSYEGWTEAEKAFCAALDTDPDYVPGDLRGFRDGLTRQGAVEAWRRLLERKDLTVEMRILAWWRLGILSPSKDGHNQRKAALEKARSIDPDLVNEQTVSAAGFLAGLPGTPPERAERWEKAYRWLATRTDQHIERSAARPALSYAGWMRFQRWDQAKPENLQQRIKRLQQIIKDSRRSLEVNFLSILKDLHKSDPAAAAGLLERLHDVAGSAKLAEWRKAIGGSSTGPGGAASRPAGRTSR